MSEASTYRSERIIKSFGGVHVLHGVDFAVRAGTIHGLFGHNGAGKSTLLKILAGAYRPSGGVLSLGGTPVEFASPRDALDQGIACVYQELRLIPDLNVADNLFLGRETSRLGLKRGAEMIDHSRKLLAQYKLRIDPQARVRDLSHPEKQMVEVIANLDRKARFVFLDEPTTALDGRQAEDLLQTVRRIALDHGIGVVLVSHKLDEVLGVCDEATVLAAGRVVFQADRSGLNKAAIVDAIVGDATHDASGVRVREPRPVPARQLAAPSLKVVDLVTPRLKGVNLQAWGGEILGVYGLIGAGRTRFCRALFGLEPVTGGTIHIGDRGYTPADPEWAYAHGVTYLTEERKRDGFIPGMSAVANVSLPVLSRYRRGGLVDHGLAARASRSILARLKTRGRLDDTMVSLSGGNQQKVLFARVIEQDADVILLDEPTKGVDIGAKADIYAIIRGLADEGRCVIVVSSEEEELLEIADSIVVFRDGTCDGEAVPVGRASIGWLRQAAWSHSE